MKKILLILILFSFASCASRQYGDPTRQREAQKVQKENNKNLRSQFGRR